MRLIDADNLKNVMIETLEAIKENPKMDNQEAHIISAFHTVGLMVDDAPTVDAVPVVRCKDCKHSEYLWGKIYCTMIGEDDYCSHGERKENADYD